MKKKKKKKKKEEKEEERGRKAAIQLFLVRFSHKQDYQQKIQSSFSILHHTISGLLVFFILMT
jgi:predicted nucleic acid-binding protein